MITVCAICGKEFDTGCGRTKYCSKECAYVAKKVRERKYNRAKTVPSREIRKKSEPRAVYTKEQHENMVKLFVILRGLQIPKSKAISINMERLKQAYRFIEKMKLIIVE